MSFVIVAPAFYPLPNAEAYCSTRFASALAKAGYRVHVVTYERPAEMFANSYDVLVHPAVTITRIKASGKRHRFPYISWRWLSVEDNDTFNASAFVAAVKKVLAQYENPILISRSYSWLSLMVAWSCRKRAAKWIAHFSDPMLDCDANTKLGRLSHSFKKIWMRRAMRHADAISVTCKRVRWYYRERLGPCVDKAKFILATHIGDFKLEGASSRTSASSSASSRTSSRTSASSSASSRTSSSLRTSSSASSSASSRTSSSVSASSSSSASVSASVSLNCEYGREVECKNGRETRTRTGDSNLTTTIEQSNNPNNRTILHDGEIYAWRGIQILDAIRNLNEAGIAVDFIQGRPVSNEEMRQKILLTPHCFILDDNASDELRSRVKTAQVSFVADFAMEGVPYSTHLMSKFVYQLFTDRPMVVLSKAESEKHDYCVKYPKAGLFFADMKKPGSLETAIKAAFACDPKTIDRTRIRERFSEEHIAAEFIEQLECEDLGLLRDRWMKRV